MARNKYPEVTVERILDAAQRLFLEKGYDNTTIQDIVDELDGLTKGAVYHHFRSKEEIMDAVGDRMFRENNPFLAVMDRKDLNGLQKLRVIYPNIMQLEYDNRRTRENPELTAAQAVEQKSEMELFMEFYELQNNQPMSQIQEEFVRNIIREVKE